MKLINQWMTMGIGVAGMTLLAGCGAPQAASVPATPPTTVTTSSPTGSGHPSTTSTTTGTKTNTNTKSKSITVSHGTTPSKQKGAGAVTPVSGSKSTQGQTTHLIKVTLPQGMVSVPNPPHLPSGVPTSVTVSFDRQRQLIASETVTRAWKSQGTEVIPPAKLPAGTYTMIAVYEIGGHFYTSAPIPYFKK